MHLARTAHQHRGFSITSHQSDTGINIRPDGGIDIPIKLPGAFFTPQGRVEAQLTALTGCGETVYALWPCVEPGAVNGASEALLAIAGPNINLPAPACGVRGGFIPASSLLTVKRASGKAFLPSELPGIVVAIWISWVEHGDA